MIAVMVVAILSVHAPHGFFAQNNGYELPLAYIAIALIIAVGGPGAYSLDAWLGLSAFWTPALQWGFVGLGVLGGVGNMALRRKPAATQQPTAN